MNEAIRNLYPILSQQDRMQYAYLVEPALTAQQNQQLAEIRRSLRVAD